jgi:hypothetical protein
MAVHASSGPALSTASGKAVFVLNPAHIFFPEPPVEERFQRGQPNQLWSNILPGPLIRGLECRGEVRFLAVAI